MTPSTSGNRSGSPRILLLTAGLVALYVVASIVARPRGEFVPALHPWAVGAAFSLAVLTRGGSRWLLPVLAAALAGELAGGLESPMLAIWRAIGETFACAIAATLLRRPAGQAPDLKRVRCIARFIAAVALIAALVAVSASLAASVVGGASSLDTAAIGLRQLLATAVAALLVTPSLMMLNVPHRRPHLRRMLSFETLLQVTALAVIAWEVFGRYVNAEVHFFYLLFLPLGWIAMRHGQTAVAVALAVIYVAPLASDWFVPHRDAAIIELQIRLAVLAITGLLLGAMVSERRRSEAQMLARQAELAHVQRLNVGWEMASALAHELNQPLTAAMNYTQAAQRLIAAPAPDIERATRAMDKSVDQIERVGRIIHGLRDFMRKGELALAATDIADIVDDAARLVSAEVNAGGVTMEANGLEGLPTVLADKTQLVQVVVNLMRNSIQALTTAGTAAPMIVVSGGVTASGLEIMIVDNGPGLDPHVAARLFEPFVTTKESGMGLGLSISKSIVEAHGGKLTAESPSRGGTILRIVLPLVSKGPSHV